MQPLALPFTTTVIFWLKAAHQIMFVPSHFIKIGVNNRHTQFMLIAAVAISLRMVSPIGGFFSYILLAAYSIAGSRQTLEAFVLSWFITLINPAISPDVQFGEFGRYIIVLAAATSSALRFAEKDTLKISKSMLIVYLFGILLLLHSIFVSQMPTISILKATAWLLVVGSILAAANSLTTHSIAVTERNIFGFLIVVVVSGVILIPTTAGFLRNGSGFQGLLNHPQVFGTLCAILLVRYLSMEIGHSKFNAKNSITTVLLIYLIFLSQNRTALISVVISIFPIIFLSIISGKNIGSNLGGILSRKSLIMALIFPLFLLLSWGSLSDVVTSFMVKTTSVTDVSLIDQYQTSRGFLLERSISNILNHPIYGIGFGVPSVEYDQPPTLDPIFGLPISFPVEKGNAFVAIIEETGLLLGSSLIAWLIYRVVRSARFDITAVMLSTVCLVVNFGEAVFFSPGGQGILILVIFFTFTQRKISR